MRLRVNATFRTVCRLRKNQILHRDILRRPRPSTYIAPPLASREQGQFHKRPAVFRPHAPCIEMLLLPPSEPATLYVDCMRTYAHHAAAATVTAPVPASAAQRDAHLRRDLWPASLAGTRGPSDSRAASGPRARPRSSPWSGIAKRGDGGLAERSSWAGRHTRAGGLG